mmetsp:Transcript_3333/g.4818  ORF Transcript_3333/g.4818 Transcript_3333/m.4818 type:complete len:202 (-) Transcript_3333:39-644(-)
MSMLPPPPPPDADAEARGEREGGAARRLPGEDCPPAPPPPPPEAPAPPPPEAEAASTGDADAFKVGGEEGAEGGAPVEEARPGPPAPACGPCRERRRRMSLWRRASVELCSLTLEIRASSVAFRTTHVHRAVHTTCLRAASRSSAFFTSFFESILFSSPPGRCRSEGLRRRRRRAASARALSVRARCSPPLICTWCQRSGG